MRCIASLRCLVLRIHQLLLSGMALLQELVVRPAVMV
jgi:hypothetical protein